MTRYDAYRPSGIDWLGDVPTHWAVKRLRFALHKINPVGTKLPLPADTLVSFVPMNAVGEYGGLNLEQEKPLDEIGSGYTFFADNDVIVAKITPCFENGKGALASGLTNGIAFGTTELHVLRPAAELDGRFLFYLTTSELFRRLGEAHMYGAGGQKRVPEEFVKNLPVPLPPLDEQRDIAAFLDRRTAHLDGLIERKEALLALLTEQRAALITRAVTSGLDPAAPLRDSGVPWLGQVPAHWDVKRLKFVTLKIGSGKTPRGGADVYVSQGVTFLRSQNIHFDGLELSDVAFIEPSVDVEMKSTRVKAGDVLLNITGASLGRVAMAGPELGPANVNQHVCILRPNADEIDSVFLWKLLASPIGQAQIFRNEQGISRDALKFEQIADLILCVPPLPEQSSIAVQLSEVERPLVQLSALVRTHIEKLREYRSALITAAVTGQIDVRAARPEPDATAAESR